MSALATPPSTVFVISGNGSPIGPILEPLRSRLGSRVVHVPVGKPPGPLGQHDIAVVVGADQSFVPVWDHMRWSRCRKLLIANNNAGAVDSRLFDRVWRSEADVAASTVVEHVLHHSG